MNKQMIEELVEKAIASIPQGAYEIPDSFCEKFAELIVRECAKFIDENSGYDDSNNAWHPEPEDLLNHFGVGQ